MIEIGDSILMQPSPEEGANMAVETCKLDPRSQKEQLTQNRTTLDDKKIT
jgi:hypothetical protein